MGERCVELFIQEVKKNKFDIYHFNVREIDGRGLETGRVSCFPEITTSFFFYKERMLGRMISMVVENIFSLEIYEKENGFQDFDLAWTSDDASWIKFMRNGGMKTILGDSVYWRNSIENITPNISPAFEERKLNSLLHFYEWILAVLDYEKKWKLIIINFIGYIKRIRLASVNVDMIFLRKNVYQFAKMHKMIILVPFILCFVGLNKYVHKLIFRR